ncbi:MAG: hypothetical protein ACKV2T_00075 [Kofleriaceae bacterium]
MHLLRLRVIFVAAMLATSVAPSPADACTTSCNLRPAAASAARAASVAFVGTITKTNVAEKCVPKHPTWCTRTYTYEVTVEGVWKGSLGPTIVVDAGHNRGDCSIGSLGKDVTNQRWLFFSRDRSREKSTPVKLRMCGGSRRATDKDIAAITAGLGAPVAP